ncbi:MAG TPA: YfiR family protein [Vicinamibacterales bacterium]|nr:YfiR family protein [Vicinamibacterales bacterium]
MLVAIVLALSASARAAEPPEYAVKAAYILNFIHLTRWPEDAFAQPSAPLHVCVVGSDVFGGLLDSTLNGETAGPHPLVVDHVSAEASLRSCHLAFVSRGATERALSELRELVTAPILTIGESDRLTGANGIITFVVDGQRVRFDVNRSAALSRHLTLSSRLLRVARVVR